MLQTQYILRVCIWDDEEFKPVFLASREIQSVGKKMGSSSSTKKYTQGPQGLELVLGSILN